MNSINFIDRLIREEQIINQKGMIRFNYAGIDATIISKDIVGNTIQDWFGQWLSSKNIIWNKGIHSQSWPDFVLEDGSHLEVKTFDASASPNFDIANFDAFIRSLWDGDVHRLDTPHLVFSYLCSDTGEIRINDYWIKKMWELTGPSDKNILNLQVKQDNPVNIRPKNWRSTQVKLFTTRLEFVVALSQAIQRFRPNKFFNWFEVVEEHYIKKFGCHL